jgi:hypothetical protein
VQTQADNVEALPVQTHVLLLQVFHLVYRYKIYRNLQLKYIYIYHLPKPIFNHTYFATETRLSEK